MRLQFWRRDTPGQLTVDVLRARLKQEAVEEQAAEQEGTADPPTLHMPVEYGHGAMPDWVRQESMESSDRYGGPEVTG